MRSFPSGPEVAPCAGPAPFAGVVVGSPDDPCGAAVLVGRNAGPRLMTVERRERLRPENRLTSSRDYATVKASGIAFRGRYCLMLALARPGEPTRFGFVASKRGVGDAVRRNRARRRLRELVRRRWPRLRTHGYWIAVIAFRGALDAPHQELATDVEHVLARAGALSPVTFPVEPHLA